MSRLTARFLGGPLHGQLRALPKSSPSFTVVTVPLYAIEPCADTRQVVDSPIHEVRYIALDQLWNGAVLYMPEGK